MKLKPDPDSRGGLLDNGSTFRASSSGHMVVNPGTECPFFTRSSLSDSGLFNQPGASIGGRRSRDMLTIGANGETSGFGYVTSCLGVQSGPSNGSFTLPECDGTLDGTAPGMYLFDCRQPVAPTQLSNPKINYKFWSVFGHVRVP